jgi:hypothetical protein
MLSLVDDEFNKLRQVWNTKKIACQAFLKILSRLSIEQVEQMQDKIDTVKAYLLNN